MKSFPFVACFIIGLWLGYYFGINTASEPDISETTPTGLKPVSFDAPETKDENIQRLNRDHEKMLKEIEHLRMVQSELEAALTEEYQRKLTPDRPGRNNLD